MKLNDARFIYIKYIQDEIDNGCFIAFFSFFFFFFFFFPPFFLGKVDLVISGHIHSYLRSCATWNGKCVDDRSNGSGDASEKGIVYVVDGTAGAYSGVAGTGEGYNCTLPQPPFAHAGVLAEDCMWGWSKIKADETQLLWQHKRWLTGDVGDEVTIQK